MPDQEAWPCAVCRKATSRGSVLVYGTEQMTVVALCDDHARYFSKKWPGTPVIDMKKPN